MYKPWTKLQQKSLESFYSPDFEQVAKKRGIEGEEKKDNKSMKFIDKLKQFFCSHYKCCEKIGIPRLDGMFLGDKVHLFQKVKCKKCGKEFEYHDVMKIKI